MKTNSIATAVAIFMLGGLVGHIATRPSAASAEANVTQVSSFELTLRAVNLPVQSADAI
jgi:hypothetical protein